MRKVVHLRWATMAPAGQVDLAVKLWGAQYNWIVWGLKFIRDGRHADINPQCVANDRHIQAVACKHFAKI